MAGLRLLKKHLHNSRQAGKRTGGRKARDEDGRKQVRDETEKDIRGQAFHAAAGSVRRCTDGCLSSFFRDC